MNAATKFLIKDNNNNNNLDNITKKTVKRLQSA